jgi:ketosteroid isomerase-like protein
MTQTIPDRVTEYLAAAEARDVQALAQCFTPDATVLDEGRTYRGHQEIIGWREALASQFTYTSQVTEAGPGADGSCLVGLHIEGDFPGGVVDLRYRFTFRDGLIESLAIME